MRWVTVIPSCAVRYASGDRSALIVNTDVSVTRGDGMSKSAAVIWTDVVTGVDGAVCDIVNASVTDSVAEIATVDFIAGSADALDSAF